ncbi:transmembrane protein 45B-like [Patiria miniata]|uniref:Transmembrane protein 45B n=1 Tax=Patiria miniata TaxID=46514 RepID=A0A914APK1_PATMI|nr:transmembrane protein 45B-like [Patiria miniata]
MGTFAGHALPGSFFILFSIWWMIQYAYEQIALDNGRQQPRGRIMRTLHRLPIEGITVVLAGFIGFIAENMYPSPKWGIFDKDGNFAYTHVWQHCEMYTFFALYGLADILSKTCMPKAEKYTKILGSLAFFVEGLLFHFHTVGRTTIDTHLHNLLVYAIAACVVLTLAEAFYPKEGRFRALRCVAVLLQGTWFFQVGTVLYWPPSGKPWDDEDMANLMFLTEAFAWHLLVDILLMLMVYGISCLVLKKTGLTAVHYRKMNGIADGEDIEFGTRVLLDNGAPNNLDSDNELFDSSPH